MDATTRWETAAMRSTSRDAQKPPQPSGKRKDTTPHWVTLREAEAATSVPVNTLRKWVRKADLPSYLESDGDIAVRFVDLDAVIDRATSLGRVVEPLAEEPKTSQLEPTDHDDDAEPMSSTMSQPETMIVPVDAWNKMLTQLGNLHEAGQQLAEARERAAKAETEASFLRERLSELRTIPPDESPEAAAQQEPEHTLQVVLHEEQSDDEPGVPAEQPPPEDRDTTTYWRYLTSGWRDRKRRMASHPDP